MTSTTTWREERRQDRAAQAQIDRDDEAARAKLRTAERRAALDRAEAKRKAKAARTAARLAALRARTVDLVLAPVIVTGAVLAWFGMGGYGVHAYGPVGIILPVLSEGGMWAFAAATTITLRRAPGSPVWHLRTGTAVFALVGAALNYLHGVHDGQALAVTMAIVSVSGVAAHQLITAGPRRSRADRTEARIQRRMEKRIREAREAAVDAAPVDLHAPGGPAIMLPGEPPATLSTAPPPPVPALPPAQRQPVTKAVTVAVNNGHYGTLSLSFIPTVRMPAQTTAAGQVKPPVVKAETKPPATAAPPPPKPPAERSVTAPRRRGNGPDKLGRLIAKGGLTNAMIAQQANVSLSTVERRQREIREAAARSHGVVDLAARRHA